MTVRSLERDGAKLNLHLDGPAWGAGPTATIGSFSCTSHQAGKALVADALDVARQAERTGILGPMEGDTWHGYRFVTESDGSPAFMMEPPDKARELAVLRQMGFDTVARYFSARVQVADVDLTPPPDTASFRIQPWNGTDPEDLFRKVHQLSTAAFAQNAFYKPIPVEAFLAMYMPMVPLLKPEFIQFAWRPDDTLAGFLFAIPDYAQGPQSRSLILKTYASLEHGAGRHLVHACKTMARDLGFETIIHALIHDANDSAARSAAEGGRLFRRYELLGRRLHG